ncbi:MAG: CRISPR-associated protein Cas4 [Planctomycetaceae bacterium]
MDLDFSGILLTVSDVLEHLYCPRFTWFEKYQMLPEFQERRAKVQMGRSLHETRENTNRGYLRKRLNAVDKRIDVSLVSERYCLRGRVDEVLFFEDGTAAPLDYKFARDPGVIYRTLRFQSAIYALLIQEHFQCSVTKGFVVYTRSNNAVRTIDFTPADFQEVGDVLKEMLNVIQNGYLPRRAPPSHCADCCYRRICT